MSKKIGYIRVSTFGQNPGRQLEGLTLDKVFVEHASGKDTHRSQLALLLDYVRDGDQVYDRGPAEPGSARKALWHGRGG